MKICIYIENNNEDKCIDSEPITLEILTMHHYSGELFIVYSLNVSNYIHQGEALDQPKIRVYPEQEISLSSSASIKLKVNHVSHDLNDTAKYSDNAEKTRSTRSDEDKPQSSHS